MSDPYKDIGFDSNRIGFGKRAGVVVVDFQKGFTESRFPLGGRPMVERAVNNTAQLLAAARKAGLPVASCYTAYSSARDAPLWKIPTVVNEFHHGHPCTELDERIYDRAYDMVVFPAGTFCHLRHSGDELRIGGCEPARLEVADVLEARPDMSSSGECLPGHWKMLPSNPRGISCGAIGQLGTQELDAVGPGGHAARHSQHEVVMQVVIGLFSADALGPREHAGVEDLEFGQDRQRTHPPVEPLHQSTGIQEHLVTEVDGAWSEGGHLRPQFKGGRTCLFRNR